MNCPLGAFPRTVELSNVKSFVVISDVHLRDPSEPRARELITMLRGLPAIDHLFLLGDIFDFVFAQSAFYLNRWGEIFREFQQLGSQGTKIVFIEGNHDFGFSLPLPNRLADTFALSGDLIINFYHPAFGKVMLRHGDDIVCNESYLSFRKVVKAPLFQHCADLIPGLVMEQIFSRWAKFSRSNDTYRKLTADFFRASVQARVASDALKPDLLVMGHVHEHIDAKVENIRCLTGPDWFQAPNFLYCSEDGAVVRTFASGKVLPLFQLVDPS